MNLSKNMKFETVDLYKIMSLYIFTYTHLVCIIMIQNEKEVGRYADEAC